MFCTECGYDNRNDRKFCENCGAALKDYSKPRENLIMPEDIKHDQDIVLKQNVIRKKFNIALAIIEVVAIALLIVSLFLNDQKLPQLIVLIVAVCLQIAFVICVIIRGKMIKKLNNSIKN